MSAALMMVAGACRAAAGGTTTYAADDFNRADGSLGTSSHGEAWSTPDTSGSTFAMVIVGNKATGANDPGFGTIDTGQTSYTVSADITANSDTPRLIFRSTTSITPAAYMSVTISNIGHLALFEHNGAGGIADNGGGLTIDGSTTYHVEVAVTPTTVTVKLNGALQFGGAVASTWGASNTRVGLMSGITSRFDNLLVTP